MPVRFKPRNEFVLVRIHLVDTNRAGIAIPQVSAEGKSFVVEAVGDAVNGLRVGDRVLMVGKPNEDYWTVSGYKDLIMIKQQCVALIVEEVPDEQPPV